ncbi:MAG TPA: PIN domain-containing protein [Candidatus Saccharimonadales bacterium]
MSFILDTSAYSAFNRGDKRLRAWFSSDNDIIVPIIVIGELRAGFVAGTKQKENEELLQRFIDSPNVYVQTVTDKTTVIYSQIYLKLRETGKLIGTNDMWIAAIALELDNELLTLDGDFVNVPDLMLGAV